MPVNKKLIQLANDIEIRRESFGCLCLRKSTGKVYQFNNDAFVVLSQFLKPESISQALQRIAAYTKNINYEQIQDFFIHCFEQGILQFAANTSGEKRMVGGDWTFAASNYLKAPLACTIYITDFCPKACRHCITSSSPKVSIANELTAAQWLKAFSILREAGVMQLIITGGDPMSRPDILAILRHADNLGFYISLLTDFDDLTAGHIGELKHIDNLRYIQTSLDGATPDTHDFIRGKGSFQKTMKRLELFRHYEMNYTISTSVYKYNLVELYQVAEISKQFEAECLYLNPIAPYGRAKRFPSSLLLDQFELEKLASIYIDLIVNHNINSGNSFWQEQAAKGIENFDPSIPFLNVLDSVTIATALCSINSHGDIYLDSKLKSEKTLKLGNILQDGILNPWNSEKLQPLRKQFVAGQPLKLVHINEAREIDLINT